MDLIHGNGVKTPTIEPRGTCSSCQHFERLSGECRANPPNLVVTPNGMGGAWPATRGEKWCGHWRGTTH